MRTPISSIQGYASILLSGELGPLTRRQRDAVERLRDLCRYTSSLMTNLRQLAQLAEEPNAMSWEPIDVKRLVQSVCGDLASEARRKPVRLAVQMPTRTPTVWAERDGLTQVLFNLLVNAIKFTPAKGKVTVALSAPDRMVRLVVSDTGVGISPETLPKLFQPFYHEDRPEVGAVGGTGLGLAIVKRIVERHLGSVEVHSRPGQGSTFHVVLPRRDGEEVVPEIVEQIVRHAESRREPFAALLVQTQGTDPKRILQGRLEQVVQKTIRREDRWLPIGSQEALVILVRTTAESVKVVRRLVEQVQRDDLLARHPRFRIALGLASYPTHGRSGEQLLKAARARLEPVLASGEAG